MPNTFEIRCRGIIVDAHELLLVSHVGKSEVLVLPGGHLEWGEDLVPGVVRELEEELGVKPEVGELLYIHTFMYDNVHVVEFFFKIENGQAYRECQNKSRSHAFELDRIVWVPLGSEVAVRPAIIAEHLAAGTLLLQSALIVHNAH